jgi:hypothetical protein
MKADGKGGTVQDFAEVYENCDKDRRMAWEACMDEAGMES